MKRFTFFRKQFSSAEEHHEILYDNICSNVVKRDVLWFMGDVAFDKYWLDKVAAIKCTKVLVLGNHDIQRGNDVTIKDIANAYDKVFSLVNYKGFWMSHCPIHPDEMRNRLGNVHGHCHDHIIDDPRYISVCAEHTNWKPINFNEIKEKFHDTK